MPVEIIIRFSLEFTSQNGSVQYPTADCVTDEKIITVKLAEETIVFRQLDGYLVHLTRLIKRPYNEQDLLPSECSFSRHTGQSSIYILYKVRTCRRNHNSLIYLK